VAVSWWRVWGGGFRFVGDVASSSQRVAFRGSPEFRLEDGAAGELVYPTRSLAVEDLLGPVQLTIVRLFQAAPHGILDRETLMQRCLAAGLNLSSASVYMTYGECIEHQPRTCGLHVGPL
jgi:hypothetical protein